MKPDAKKQLVSRAGNNREDFMNRTTTGMLAGLGIVSASLAGLAHAQNSSGTVAIDASLRGAVERKDVPGVVALVGTSSASGHASSTVTATAVARSGSTLAVGRCRSITVHLLSILP